MDGGNIVRKNGAIIFIPMVGHHLGWANSVPHMLAIPETEFDFRTEYWCG